MKLNLMTEYLFNLEKIETLIEEESFELINPILENNDQILYQIQSLQNELTPETQEQIEKLKQLLLKKNQEILNQLQIIHKEKKPEYLQMSQKVQASRVYNNMQRNLY